jgi:hypothetical protein
MKNKRLKIPSIILAVGLVLAVVASLLTGIVKAPVITEQDFHFAVTYRLDGETKTLEGIYRSHFRSTGKGTDPLNRHYEGEHLLNPAEDHPAAYTIAEKDGLELCIVAIFSDRYLMGDADSVDFHYDPYLAAMDSEGYEYEDEETLSRFDAEIIDWSYPDPVDNSFKFVGFSKLHDDSMFAMLAVGILMILACMIFVKRDKTVPYKALDKISIVFNCIVFFVALPFIAFVTSFLQITMSGDELVYQIYLCIPALTAFTVAASIALRRVRYTKAGFFVQFIGPVLFALPLISELDFI